MADATKLADSLAQLPSQPIAALRIVAMVEDPSASAADLARLIETDPALSTRVMRLANSPYYGLTRKISSASRAVVLLGFSTVRALAVSAACGLLSERGQLGPPGYWPHSVAAAAGASVVARTLQISPGDAFSAGLLHDLGTVLLQRQDNDAYTAARLRAEDPNDPVTLAQAEYEAFEMTHSEAGARVLDLWKFPKSFVRALEEHHRHPTETTDTMARVVIAGEALALRVDETMYHDPSVEVPEALEALGLNPQRANRMVRMVKDELDELAVFLEVS